MTQVDQRRRWRAVAFSTATAVATSLALAVPPASAQARTTSDLFTDHVVVINETVSDAGFVHPGIGLSAEDLRRAQAMVRSGEEPWASYFDAMSQVRPWAGEGYTVNNMVRGQPDTVLSPNFDHGGLRGRMTQDSFGTLTQALMWVMTGDEVYRKGAIMGLRTWSNMNPDGYVYFPDAHIHTGKPLSQFLMAAEIVRATDPVDDGTPGTHEGYDVVWHPEDDEKLLDNLAFPIRDVFNFSNEKWMNQHNFGLYGRIATAIYADDADAYATGVEWFTVNSAFDDYINGAMAPQMPLIAADDPINPYGHDFVQVREMGRDQAHGETNIDNFAALARFLDVQGTLVDPVDGTVSTDDDAVSAYQFLDRRLLHGADAFYGFMMGAPTPWVDERGEGWDGTVSQAYRGRIFNAMSELYLQYTHKEGVDVEDEAPWLAELHRRMDGPFYQYGTGTANFWAPGDKSVEYWVAFPEALAGTEPRPLDDTRLDFGRYSLQLDDRSELVTEDDRTFVRARVDERGTTNVVSRIMYPGGSQIGVLVRTDGPVRLEVRDKEGRSGRNDNEDEPRTMSVIDIPDLDGRWRYVTYPASGQNTHYYRLTGAAGTTVDLDRVLLAAQDELHPPRFEPTRDRFYLWPDATSTFDLSSVGGASVDHRISGAPTGAAIDTATGLLTWKPTPRDRGAHTVQVVADDGESIAAMTVELVVAKNRPKTVDAAVADGVDADAVHTTVTREPYETALTEARAAAKSGTDAEFRAAFERLLDAIDALEPLNPRLTDGSLDFRGGVVTPTVISAGAVDAMADGNVHSHSGDLRVESFTLDFGTRYRIAVEEFGFQARFAFPMRSAGTNAYGSHDGVTWVLLTERPTAEVNPMETIPVAAEHRGTAFRYLKLQVDDPAPPIDPAGPGIWSLGELRIFGDRSELAGTITDVSLTSPDALRQRVIPGDTAVLEFASPTPIDDVAVTIDGEPADASSDDGLSWTASAELGDADGARLVGVSIDHTTEDGTAAATVRGTTDGSALYLSDERNLVDLATAAEVVDGSGRPDPDKAAHSAAMLDGDAATFSDIALVDGEATLVWDFGDGGSITLDRVDFLARQDNNGTIRMDDLVLQGSRDLRNWTTLTAPTAREHAWQPLSSLDDGDYRYLRVRNGAMLSIAELRVFGEHRVELDAAIARAEALDLDRHSRASAILFTRELDAVKAAAEEDGADRDALSKRLLDAWHLLEEPPSTILPVEPSWVEASSASWDGGRDPAANGWSLFDGDPATYTDTTAATGWVRIAPDDGRFLTVAAVRVQPRPGHAHRANGFQIQGSDDGGATWTTFLTLTTPAASGWTAYTVDTPASYKALRLYSHNGYTNLAELRFMQTPLDDTGLRLLLEEAGGLSEDDWTAESWADLTAARDAAEALLADGARPTQDEVDAAASTFAEAVDGLRPAA